MLKYVYAVNVRQFCAHYTGKFAEGKRLRLEGSPDNVFSDKIDFVFWHDRLYTSGIIIRA